MFSGTLPNELTQLTNLEELVLGQSYISGPIPEKIGDMESLGKEDKFEFKINPIPFPDLNTNTNTVVTYQRFYSFGTTEK